MPHPLTQKSRPGAKELKEGKAQEHSWAKATSPELPRGQSLPSVGGPGSERQHSLHITSLAPLPEPGLFGPRVTQARATKQVLTLPGLLLGPQISPTALGLGPAPTASTVWGGGRSLSPLEV